MEDKHIKNLILRIAKEELAKEEDPEEIKYLEGIIADCEMNILLSNGGTVQ